MQTENENRASEAIKPDSAAEDLTSKQLGAEVAADRAAGASRTLAMRGRGDDDQSGMPALTSMEAIAQQSLDRALNGAPDQSEVPRFADKYYAPVGSNFDYNARSAAFEAAKATGIQSVANMDIQAGDVNLKGPVTFTDSGRQILFNTADGRKYELLPPDGDNPKGSVMPFGRDAADSQPVPISQQKVVPGFGDGNDLQSRRISDANFNLQPQPMSAPEAGVAGDRRIGGDPAAAGARSAAANLSPEQIAQIRQQLQEHPEWISQLQQSKDPRAAMLLEIAGKMSAGEAAAMPGAAERLAGDRSAGGSPLESFLSQYNNAADRSAIISVLELAARGRLPVEEQGAQSGRMQELMQGIGAQTFAALKGLLLDQLRLPLSLENQSGPLADRSMQARLRDFLDLALNGGTSRGGDGSAQSAFLSLLHEGGRFQNPFDSNVTAANIIELRQLLGQFNGTRTGEPLDLRDVLGRAFDASGKILQVREVPMIKDLIDRALGRTTEQTITQRPDARVNNELGTHVAAAETAFGGKQQDRTGKRLPDWKEEEDRKAKDDAIRRLAEEEAKARKAAEEARRLAERQTEQGAIAAAIIKQPPKDIGKEEEEEPVDKTKRDDEKRQKYIVQQGDTLESIAAKMLRDTRLAALIYEINRAVIPLVNVGGKRFPHLTAKMVIWLPNATDIQKYRERMLLGTANGASAQPQPTKYANAEEELAARFGEGWSDAQQNGAATIGNATPPSTETSGGKGRSIEELGESAHDAVMHRKGRIESLLGPLSPEASAAGLRYVVRLGDTLKSIAMKHPQLNDVQLWPLLAEINGLTIAPDQNGAPVCAVRRGQSLRLPTADEIAEFRATQSPQTAPVEPAKPQTRKTNSKLKSLKAAARPQVPVPDAPDAAAPAASRGGAQAAPPVNVAPPASRVSAQPVSPVAAVPSQPVPGQQTNSDLPAQPDDLPAGWNLLRKQEGGRVLIAGDLRDTAAGLKLKLEAHFQGKWMTAVFYEIYSDVSLRHEYKLDGSRKTIRINLPPPAAAELAHNDLLTNLTAYCDKFCMRKSAR